MSLRELVTGGAACAPEEGEASSSAQAMNPLSRMANAMFYEPTERAGYQERGMPLNGPGPSRPMPPPAHPGRLAGPPHPWEREFLGAGNLPAEEEALFENTFAGGAANPQEMRDLEQRAYQAAFEMHGGNTALVEQEVMKFLHEVQSGVAPPPPGLMQGPPGPGAMAGMRGPVHGMNIPFENDFEAAFALHRGAPPGMRHARPPPPASFAEEFHAQENDWVQAFEKVQIAEGQGSKAVAPPTVANPDEEFAKAAESAWKASGEELANEFVAEENKPAEEWAQELAEEESWGEKFASLEGQQESYEEALFNYLGRDADLTEYEFIKDNPYLNHSDAFGEAKRLLEAGEMGEATLALEAVVQKEPQNSRAWYLLGEAQAECDNDPKAIAALKRCVEIGEDGESHADALFSLGVSYANELNQSRSLQYLKRWMDLHPKYNSVTASIPASDAANEFAAHGELLQRVLNGVKVDPADPQLHSIVGVLYNLSREYEEGQAAFLKALEIKGDDYKLWNRLGATFANGENHVEALSAYRKAVDLKPGYVRAWVNVGTAYANQGKLEHASRFYLRGLALNPEASHIWSYLRTVLLAMQRADLLPFVEQRNLEEFKKALPF